MQISLVDKLLGHIYGNPIKCELQYRRVYNYLDKYIKKIHLVGSGESVNINVKRNKTIWICWFQGIEQSPKVVKACYRSVKRNIPEDYDIVLITFDNVSDYIKLPEFVWDKFEKGVITATHLSDIIRTELLYEYGGAWVDATVYCSSTIPRYMLSGEMFLFKWSMFDKSVFKMSSWWIYAAKDNEIIVQLRALLYLYWERENSLRDYFLFHIMFSKVVDSSPVCQAIYRNIIYSNNSNPHALYGKMGAKYSEELWNCLKDVSKVHKLSYKKNFLQGDIDSFYMALIKNRLV